MEKEDLLEVTTMFRTLIRGITQEWNKRGGEYNLSFPQFKMLHMLSRSGPQRVSTIAEKLGLTSAAITGLTDRLVSEGYVLRARDDSDRRVVYITVTELGKEIVDQVIQGQEESNRTIFSTLDDGDIQHLKRIFSRMIAYLEKEN
ncbi:MarR family transcriptional regulator [Paenibacillus faecis]|nr:MULTISPECIES: MarR family transcriptional regulator [Paenibacillus]MCA1293612.1 MarR family transcriptional regulator [Paenibacillus sp. alder61]GIO88151.1 MarR family transcriptional regulator [Paenibacillus faecis]